MRYTGPAALLLLLAGAAGACVRDVPGESSGQEHDSKGSAGGGAEPAYSDDVEPVASGGRTLSFYYGPMKLMYAESILYSITAITGHAFGTWNTTSPDPGTQAFVEAGNGEGDFYRHCRLLGGCLEHRIPQFRTSFVGTGYVLELERAAAEACSDREVFGMFPGGQPPGDATQVGDVVQHQYVRIFGSPPTSQDLERSLAYFEGHIKSPEFDDVSPLESAGRGHCRVLLTTNRFLFY